MASKNNESEQNLSEEIIEVQPIDEEKENNPTSSRSRLLTGLLLITFVLASAGLLANYYLFEKLQALSMNKVHDNSLNEQLTPLSQSIQKNSDNISQLQNQLSQLEQTAQNNRPTIEKLQQEISALTKQALPAVETTHDVPNEPQSATNTDIKTSLESLKKQLLQELQSNVSSLSSSFNQQLENLSPIQQDVEQTLNQLKQNFNQRLQKNQQQAEQKIRQLEQKIQQLLENKPVQLPPADLYLAKTRLQLIRQNLQDGYKPHQLKSSLKELEKMLEKNDQALEWKQLIEKVFANIPQHSQAQISDAQRKLSQFQQIIPELELRSSAQALMIDDNEQDSSQQRFMQELSSLIKVRYQDEKKEAVMSPQLLYFARQMLQLKVYASKLALTEQHIALYQTQINDMLLIMQDYIDIKQVKAASVYNQLKDLVNNPPAEMDISAITTQLSTLDSALSNAIDKNMH